MSSALDGLRQKDVREAFARLGTGAWTIAYKSDRTDGADLAVFTAFAPKAYRPTALERDSWDMRIGGGYPGFMQGYTNGRMRTKYLPFGNDDGLEPLVIVQEFHEIKPDLVSISQEFRLFHNLWIDPRTGRHIKVADDGTESLAAEVNTNEVRIRTNLIRQFQAAQQLDLLIYIDSKVYIDEALPEEQLDSLDEDTRDDLHRAVFAASTMMLRRKSFSRLLAKKIFPAPARKYAGIWPYEESETYPEFIIGEDEHGAPVRYTCNHDELANYFGANPHAPHYLTSVFFRREVLQRYYEQSEKYSVTDGYLRCGELLGVQIDNNHPDYVIVFLGDLGRDLPAVERDYWRGFNVAPTGGMSEPAVRRSFLGQSVGATAPDLVFKSTYTRFRVKWLEALGWDLFKELEEDDEHVLLRLRVPLTESQAEFEAQVLNLTKLLVDSLNERQLQTLLGSKVEGEQGISKLERWLVQEQYPHAPRDIAFLRRLQSLRSRGAAHRKGSDYRKFVEGELGEKTLTHAASDLIADGNVMLTDLAQHFNVDLSW